MPSIKSVSACLVCFAAGVMIGLLVSGKSSGNASMAVPSQQRAERPDRLSGGDPNGWHQRSAQRQAAKGDRETSDFSHNGEPFVEVPVSALSGFDVAYGLRSTNQELFPPDGRLEEILSISPREKALVQTAWRNAGRSIRNAEVEASVMEELEDGSIRISLPDLEGIRSRIGDRFVSEVGGVMGRSRGQVLLAMRDAEKAFEGRGAESWRVETESVGNGRWRFRISLQGPEAGKVMVGETIPSEIRHLTDAAGIVPDMNHVNPVSTEE